MNAEIYVTILTGLGVIIIALIVMLHAMAKMNHQATNRRIDELKQETNRRIDDTNRRIDELRQDTMRQIADLRQDLLGTVDSKSKVNHTQSEVVGIRFQKLEVNVAEIRQEVQVIKTELLKNAA
jgi:ABC-type lipoprotein release transport system permease subunit